MAAKKSVSAPADMGAAPTTIQNSEKGFAASEALIESLQKVLVDLVELSLQGKQAHWNVVGHNFRDLHLILDDMIDQAREHSDIIAERLRAIHAVPDGRTATVAVSTALPPYPMGEVSVEETVDLVTERIDLTVGTVRAVHDTVDDADPTSADLLHAILDDLEKTSWMISAENRKA